MKKITTLACATVASLCAATAQTSSNPWAIGLYGGLTEYQGELASNMGSILGKGYSFYGHGGVSLSRYLHERWDANLFVSFGRIGAKAYKTSQPSSNTSEFKENELYADLTASFKFVKKDAARFHPFVFAGVGYRQLFTVDTEKYIGAPGGDVVLVGGVGCDLRLTERVALSYMCRYGYTFGDDKDQIALSKAGDQQMMHSFGVKVNFGAPRDSDKDGVADKFDQCPGTPEGVQVDENGCPLDADGDKVPDYLDKCPETPAGVQVDTVGCPIDSDADGVADYLDKCPETPAGVEVDENGCPVDTDGDGVADYLDKCPGTPAAAAGKVDENGCPIDTDGDGVFDYLDKCPTVKGEASNNGCPEVKAEVKQIFKKALNGIQFESGKATILKSSNKILDQVVKIMKENPDYKLGIKGHTDNSGDPAKNQKLSEDRAAAVANYLTKAGVDESRIRHKGMGDTVPVADNSTKAGRAENRRVEFVVVFEGYSNDGFND